MPTVFIRKFNIICSAGNQLEDATGDWRYDLPSLKELDLSKNQFTIFNAQEFTKVSLHTL